MFWLHINAENREQNFFGGRTKLTYPCTKVIIVCTFTALACKRDIILTVKRKLLMVAHT